LTAFRGRVNGRIAHADADVSPKEYGGTEPPGIVIVVRHGATFPDQADTDPLNFDNIAAQCNLNDNGKALAKAFWESLRLARIPVGKATTPANTTGQLLYTSTRPIARVIKPSGSAV
jgi:hypothetical protein